MKIMEQLTPLEKEIWKINHVIECDDNILKSQSWQQEIQKVKQLALYATSKAQEAIKLAREKELVDSDGFYKPRYDRKYTEEEILKIVGL